MPTGTRRPPAFTAAPPDDARFRAAFESSGDALVLLDVARDASGHAVDLTVAAVNAHAEALFGCGREALVGQRLGTLVPGHFPAWSVRDLLRVAATRLPLEWEAECPSPPGAPRRLHHRAAPAGDGVTVATRDVTERHARDRARAARAGHYQALARNFPDGAVLLYDHALRVLVADGAGIAAMGLVPAVLEGRAFHDCLPAATHAAVEPLCRAALEGRDSSGDVPLGVRVYAARAVPVRGEAGGVAAGLLLMQDVTPRRRYEEALRESEHRFRELVETVRLVAVGLDVRGRVTFCNDAMLTLTGWTREELMGQDWFERCVPDPDTRRVFDAAIGGADLPASHEYELVTRGGERRLVMWDHTVLRDPLGAIVGTASLGGDVTVRRREEAVERERHATTLALADDLAREREFLAALLEHIGDGIVACDAAGITTLCNSVMQSFAGMSAPPATPEERQSVHDNLRAADGATRLGAEELPLSRAFAGETVRDMEVVIAPPRRPRRHLLARGQAIEHPDGRKLGAVVVYRDVTDTRQAAAALAESEARFRTMVESLDEGLVITDLEDVIQHVNPRLLAITGYAPDELVGRVAHEALMPLEGPEEFRARIDRRRRGVSERFEVQHVRRDGTPVWMEVSEVPLTAPSGELIGTLSTFTDISARKAHELEIVLAKDAAEAANRAKSDFLARMSHELRTPLNSVIGFSDVMRRNAAGNQRLQDIKMLDRVSANGRHLLGLINDILDLAKVEAGRLTLELTPVACDDLVAETVGELEGTAAGKAITLDAHVPARVAPLLTDPTRLRQILVNLVGNAVKFTERGGVTVTLHADEGSGRPSRIDVTDTGIGIPADRQAQVFGAFEQADPSVTRKYGGTGLGLAITRTLCEALGYELTLRSEVGRGSTFSVVFPPTSDAD